MILQVPKYPESEALTLFQTLSKDELDTVRLYCVDHLLALSQVLPYQVYLIYTSLNIRKLAVSY